MATSGSINYSQTRNEIISDALQLLGVLGSGETAASNDVTLCSNFLNKMIKSWQAQGIHLWKEDEAVVILVDSQIEYNLSSSSSHKAGTSYVETTLSSAASSSATSLSVTSTTGMTAADNISVELDDDTSHTTTIVSVDSSTSLTITTGLASASASGSRVTTWTTALTRPLNITSARYHYRSGVERPLKKLGRSEYMSMPTKHTSTGPTTAFYFVPQLNQGKMYIWPKPDNVEDTIHISYLKTIEDFDGSSDDPDFPQEWLECLTYNLAVKVAPAFGITISKMNPDIAMTAQSLLQEIRAWDSEEGSVHITPNYRSE